MGRRDHMVINSGYISELLMGEQSDLCAGRIVTPESVNSKQGAGGAGSSGGSSSSRRVGPSTLGEGEEEAEAGGEEEPLVQTVECRICQEEDSPKNLEIPCSCSGSLKYAHRKCVQRWCNEKGDITCEICLQPYRPGYTAPQPHPPSEETVIDISGGWTVAGTQLDINDPRLLSMAVTERHLQEADHGEYADASASGAAFCRSAALFLMALLLLRHAFENDDNDDVTTFFSLFLLRAAGFLLPCFIVALGYLWVISILQRRRQRQEAAAEVAFLLQAGQQRGLHVTIAPRPAPAADEPSAATTHLSMPTRQAEAPRPQLV